MSHSTTLLDLLYASQASKELLANELFDAASPATLFGRRNRLCSGLDWFYYGGVLVVDGVLTLIGNNPVALTLAPGQTNYLEADRSGSVSANTSGFTPGSIPLYAVVTDASSVTGYTDYRAWAQPVDRTSQASVVVTTANVTLSAAEARCGYLITTGVLTGHRSVIVPDHWRADVFCANTGAFTTIFRTAGGSGIVVGQGKRCLLRADGVNVVRVTPEV